MSFLELLLFWFKICFFYQMTIWWCSLAKHCNFIKKMCRGHTCSDYWDCNGACCFGFKVPLVMGYITCSLWLLCNGITFPVMSLIFWPKLYIIFISCLICAVNIAFVIMCFLNMSLKNHILFNVVVYGVAITYVSGILAITLAVSLDVKGSSQLLRESFKNIFNLRLSTAYTFSILRSTQIIYYLYLFLSYIYCGFIVQLYEIRKSKKYRIGWKSRF